MKINYIIFFHPKAEAELLESAEWYLQRSIVTNKKFISEFERIIFLLQENPALFQLSFENKRRANLSRFPYSVIYSIEKNTVFIYSIFHNSRSPKIRKKR